MDSDDLCNIEFIDLNGVEETEQLRIRNSLQQLDPSVQLPWIKDKKILLRGKQNTNGSEQRSITETAPASHHNTFIQHPIITQPVYYNHQQPPVVVQPLITYPHPSNIVYYPTNVISPVSPPYPQQVFIPHTSYSHSYPCAVPTEEVVAEEDPIEEISKENGIEDEGIVQNGTTPEKVPETIPVSPVVQNGDENADVTASPAPANKSWASLFNSNKSASNTPTVKQNSDKNTSIQAVNKESNNNDSICPIKHPRKSQQFVDPDCYRMGEYLTSYVIDGKALSLQPRGLLNQSNYCYINSILQALVACPPLYNLLTGLAQNISSNEKRKPTPVIDGMCRFAKEFKYLPPSLRNKDKKPDKNTKKDANVLINTDIPFEPTWIYKMLNGIRTDLIEGRQEDAEEFLGFLLNGLNDEMLELIKLVKNDREETVESPPFVIDDNGDKEWKVMGPKNKLSITRRTDFDRTPISDIFGGLLKSKIHRAGDLSTENIQPFFTLQLNIEKVKTVREALEALVNKHQLEGLTSSKTNEEVEAWQQVLLDELPVILILHLKCFDYKQDGCTKIIKALEFPVDLKIDQKLLSSKTQSQKEKHYKLFAVVYHDGKEASKGHYVTDAFHIGYSCWLRYDDASVKTVQEEQVLKPQGTRVPYLLFYRRSDTIRGK